MTSPQTPQEFFSKKITDNWKDFPFKLDYLMYVYYYKNNSNNSDDIQLIGENGIYKVHLINNKSDCDLLTITKNELIREVESTFNEQSLDNHFVAFIYKTKIFENTYDFRCQKYTTSKNDLITLRLLSNNNDYDFNKFNELVEKYTFAHDLNKSLSYTNKDIKIKVKI